MKERGTAFLAWLWLFLKSIWILLIIGVAADVLRNMAYLKYVHFLRLCLVLGQSRLSTTGIYLTPSEEDLRSALGRAGQSGEG